MCLGRSDRETGDWTASVYSAFTVDGWQQNHMCLRRLRLRDISTNKLQKPHTLTHCCWDATLSSCLVLMNRPQPPLATFTGHAVASQRHNVSRFTPRACFNGHGPRNGWKMCHILKNIQFSCIKQGWKMSQYLTEIYQISHHKMGFFLLLQKWL